MKQRLTGALVLVCLAVIFVPMLLDGEGLTSPDISRAIPPPPPVPPVPTIEPELPLAGDSPRTGAAEPRPPGGAAEGEKAESGGAAASDEERPSLNIEGIPEAWSVRLGTFAEQANARALVERLVTGGYKAYSRPAGDLTAVYAGPVLTRAEAKALLGELEAEYRLNDAMVERFTIDAPARRPDP